MYSKSDVEMDNTVQRSELMTPTRESEHSLVVDGEEPANF